MHTATVAAFAVEHHPVTNAQFAEFVADTGYVTVAEQPLDPALYPGVAPQDLVPGALVFRPTSGPVDLRDWRQWWDWAPGANWRQPFGPDSSDRRPARPSGGAGRLPRRRGLRPLGRSPIADRSRVGVRRPRRRHHHLPVG